MEDKTLYPVELYLPKRHCIALWYSSEPDGLLVQEDGKLRIFADCTDALAFGVHPCRIHNGVCLSAAAGLTARTGRLSVALALVEPVF